jgi:hypothetical protein
MKRQIFYLSAFLLFGLTTVSCTDGFDEANMNPNKSYNPALQHVFPGIVYKTLNNTADLNYTRYSCYARYIQRGSFGLGDTEDNGGIFNSFYVNILKDLKKLELNYAGMEGYENTGYIILTWKAYIYSILVTTFGGVPMSEAISTSDEITYKYDTEAEIYTEILRMLAEAANGFDPQGDKLLRDPVFRNSDGSSNIGMWRKFANSLRLDIALQIQNMDVELAKTHIKGALEHDDRLISSTGEIVKLQWGSNVNADVSYYYNRFLRNFENGTNLSYGDYPSLNQYFFLYLKSYNDPRLTVYAQRPPYEDRFTVVNDTLTRPTPGDPATRDSILVEYRIPYLPQRELRYIPIGWEVANNPNSPGGGSPYSDPYSGVDNKSFAYINRDFIKPDASQVILNYADICFMKAEVAVKYPELINGSAEDYYYMGIDASFAEYGLSSGVAAYKEQDGIKWNTDGKGFYEYREFYKADIHGAGGNENHLEQIYKQRYIADFFNGHAGWTLERRTRVLKYPPFFYNGESSVQGSNGRCDFIPERIIYPKNEMNYNKDAYYAAVADLQAQSPDPNPAREGDNFFTLLRIAKPDPGLSNLNPWISGYIVYNSRFYRKWYGNTQEEFIENARKEYPEITDVSELEQYIGYKVNEEEIISTYVPE